MLTLNLDVLLSMSAEQLLSVKSYYVIFPNSQKRTTDVWRKMAGKWHPDSHISENDKKVATGVFTHLKQLRDLAEAHIQAGIWGGDHFKTFETVNSQVQFSFLEEDGVPGVHRRYVGKSLVWFEYPGNNSDLVDQMKKNLARWSLPLTPAMAADEHLFVATKLQVDYRELVNKGKLVTMVKDRDSFALNHVLRVRTIEPRHLIWIISRLQSLACLMQIRNVMNLDISTRSVFITPRTHGVVLLDGWQYGAEIGSKPLALPSRTAALCPSIVSEKKAEMKHVLELIKALGRELCGDPTGVKIQLDKTIPPVLGNWLRSPAEKDAISAYKTWGKVKVDAFGPPKWEPMALTGKDIYTE
jgi:hypothetical protein